MMGDQWSPETLSKAMGKIGDHLQQFEVTTGSLLLFVPKNFLAVHRRLEVTADCFIGSGSVQAYQATSPAKLMCCFSYYANMAVMTLDFFMRLIDNLPVYRERRLTTFHTDHEKKYT